MSYNKTNKQRIQQRQLKGTIMNPTEQQINIVSSISNGNNIKIKAGAGTGKSSTLRFVAKENPSQNFLCLCFNKKNADESNAHPEKPKNIVYSTVHSIAYKAIMPSYRSKKLFGLQREDVSKDLIESCLDTLDFPPEKKKELSYLLTQEVLNNVTIFCFSSERAFTVFLDNLEFSENIRIFLEELLLKVDKGLYQDKLMEFENCKNVLIKGLKVISVNYWDKLLNPSIKNSISHDVYLKLFQIQERKINSVLYEKESFPVSVLMGDEFQDTTECVLSIFENQDHLQKIVVGDSSQQLYDWRGAIDALEKLPGYETLYLTKSFRFNKKVAELANKVLGFSKSDLRVDGVGQHAEDKSQVFLSRTNAAALETIFILAKEKEEDSEEENSFIYTPIDVKNLFSKLFHLEACFFDSIPKYPCKELSYITNKQTFEKAIKSSEEIQGLVNISKKLRDTCGSLFNAYSKIKEVVTDDIEADIKVSTVHRFKGMEAGIAFIHDDIFPKKQDSFSEEKCLVPDIDAIYTSEYNNLLYVAITRAKNQVFLPDYLASFLGV